MGIALKLSSIINIRSASRSFVHNNNKRSTSTLNSYRKLFVVVDVADVDVVEDEVKGVDDEVFEDGSEDGKVEAANDADDDFA